jgi:hypothetical protein
MYPYGQAIDATVTSSCAAFTAAYIVVPTELKNVPGAVPAVSFSTNAHMSGVVLTWPQRTDSAISNYIANFAFHLFSWCILFFDALHVYTNYLCTSAWANTTIAFQDIAWNGEAIYHSLLSSSVKLSVQLGACN